MSLLKIAKVVASLPDPLTADTIYLVRTGAGFDLYCSDSTGSVAHKANDLVGGGGGGGDYTLPVASSSVLGGVKVGDGLEIAGDGTLSALGGGGGSGGGTVNTCRVSWDTTSAGGVSNIRGNASSVVRQGAGVWLITFATPLPDAGYAWSGGLDESETPTDNAVCTTVRRGDDLKTATQFVVRSHFNGGFYDITGGVSLIFAWGDGSVNWIDIGGKPPALAAGSTRDIARKNIGVTVGPDEPSSPQVGDLWIN